MTDDMHRMLGQTADKAAPDLLGSHIIRWINGVKLVGKIVETEAYDQCDAASHSYKGKTPRAEVMFGPAGHAYVYFTYGLHYCINIVTGETGHGSAVLIRALEPLRGTHTMQQYRARTQTHHQLTNGPAKLCQAFQIDRSFNGHNLRNKPLQLVVIPPISRDEIVISSRIGISRDTDRLWRFYIKDNPFVSKT